jgi:peptide/nickel transport system substrate-binding protein
VVADDAAGTVTLRLEQPDPTFLQKLALPFGTVVPADSPAIGTLPAVPLATTGPYRLVSYAPGRGIVLDRNPYFHEWSPSERPDGYVDSIEWRLDATTSDAATAALTGGADISLDTPPSQVLRSAAVRHPGSVHRYAGATTEALYLDARRPPFDHPGVRAAVALAVNRAAIARITGDSATVTCQLLPPTVVGYRPTCPMFAGSAPSVVWNGPDVARARALVLASGAAGAVIRVGTLADDPARLGTAREIIATLRRIGLRAQLSIAPDPHTYYDRLGSPDRPHAGVFGWVGDLPSAFAYLQPLVTCPEHRQGPVNTNPTGLCDRSLDRAIDEAATLEARDPAAASTAWHRIDQRVAELAGWVPLVSVGGADIVSARVGNYQHDPLFGPALDQLWVR